jgi:Na+/H+ antiporter NhaD/arsenite permease-like protein
VFATKHEIHEANDFDFHPIKEVAWLFLGIFATMVPALDYLTLHARALGLGGDMEFYWLTGVLSGVLDNAPTYLTFLAAALGAQGHSIDDPAHVQAFAAQYDHRLIAISLGAVFFGAFTYIGNGPNFMVKAIAAQQKVRMPGFFGYVVKYSLPVLVPVFFVVGVMFFSRWRAF